MNRVLVTGGAGFIGSNFVEFLNATSPNTEVVVFDDLSSGLLSNLHGLNYKLHTESILDYDRLHQAASGADSIVHLAAIGSVPRSVDRPRPTHEANTTGTLNVLEVARDLSIGNVIVASSSSVYGSNPNMPKNELDWTSPLSPYAVSKLATEAYSIAYQYSYGLRTVAFRFFNVFGPKQRADHVYAAVVPRFINSALIGRPLTVYGDGLQSRDFTYVESVCAALYMSLQQKISCEHPINLAFGTNRSLIELIVAIEKAIGRPVKVNYEPARAGDVLRSQADPERLRKLFPTLETVNFDVAIRKTIAWFEKPETL